MQINRTIFSWPYFKQIERNFVLVVFLNQPACQLDLHYLIFHLIQHLIHFVVTVFEIFPQVFHSFYISSGSVLIECFFMVFDLFMHVFCLFQFLFNVLKFFFQSRKIFSRVISCVDRKKCFTYTSPSENFSDSRNKDFTKSKSSVK